MERMDINYSTLTGFSTSQKPLHTKLIAGSRKIF
jgi:hypothetical protein